MNTLLRSALVGAVAAWAALAVACLFLISLGLDEAWTMMGVRAFLTDAPVRDFHLAPVNTSGGLYTLIHCALESANITKVWLQRLPSLLALFAVLAIVGGMVAARTGSAMAGILAICPMIGATDTAVIGTTAVGTSLAFLIFVLAVFRWTRRESPPWYDVAVCGTLFGLAVATRLDLLLAIPAIWLTGFVRTEPALGLRLRFPWRETIACTLAITIWGANMVILEAASPVFDGISTVPSREFHGVGGSQWQYLRDYASLLNRVLLVQADLPLVLMAIATIMPVAFLRLATTVGAEAASPLRTRTAALFVAAGWFLWAAWVARAIPAHVRYLWPSMECFAIVLGAGLAWAYVRCTRERIAWGAGACLFLGLVWVSGQAGLTFRAIVMGEQDYLARERAGEMMLDYFRRFQHRKDQEATAQYLANSIPRDDTIVSLDQPFALCYLTGRPIVYASALAGRPRPTKPVHLLVSQLVGTAFYLAPESYRWIREHAQLEAEFGRYAIYALPGGLPDDLSLLEVKRTSYVGHPGGEVWYRFGW